ncbi:hypothetical protein Nizo1840_2475 [Lactiplantibacillus plantarum]|nr:hypothetical protein SF2A35B_2588 [Lactiplantibacillus plantarum]KZT78507.1 hypothetical protein Nizo1839_2569 [Lactiplantibacillus plantarum]KZT80681.1 hypothetical protein Nizo1840_2475 [Lactiplantibacillus plantarum]
MKIATFESFYRVISSVFAKTAEVWRLIKDVAWLPIRDY